MNIITQSPHTRLLKLVLLSFIICVPFLLEAHGVPLADQEKLRNGGLLAYITVGAKHMLTGYDHLLFLVGVIFYLNNFKDILKFITVFTVGHCITLIFATYQGITANEHLIDAVIALSVLYKGFENLGGFKKIFNVSSPNLLFMVWIFGLIHGFGLSARLQAFNIGTSQFLEKILCFNIGVEVGQILALIPIVFLLTRFKKSSKYETIYTVVNWFLIAAGIALFIFQMVGYFSNH